MDISANQPILTQEKKTCECLEILALTIYYYIYKLDA